MKERRSKN